MLYQVRLEQDSIEPVQGEISKRFRNSPEMQQWASALVGATAASVVGGNTKVGASTAASGTKIIN